MSYLRYLCTMQTKNTDIHPAIQGVKVIQRGILVNLALAVLKGLAGLFGHSFALVADAIESLADVFTSFIVWAGLRSAAKPPDDNHPYGHGRAEPLAGIVVAVSLFVAAVFIAVESVHNIQTPHVVPHFYTLIVLGVVIAIKEYLYRWVNKTGAEIGSTAVKGDAWHHRSDALTSLAAAIGIGIAVIGGPGYESADDWAALVAAALIVVNAVLIFLPAFHEVMDKAPPQYMVEKVRLCALAVEGVLDVEKCFIRKSGFEYFVDIHIVVDGNLSVRIGHKIGHDVKDAIMANMPAIYNVLTHVEPDVFED